MFYVIVEVKKLYQKIVALSLKTLTLPSPRGRGGRNFRGAKGDFGGDIGKMGKDVLAKL